MLRALVLVAVIAAPAAAQSGPFVTKVYKNPDGHESPYAVFVPARLDKAKPVPVVLFLHGAGETKKDGQKTRPMPVEQGIATHLAGKFNRTFPAVVVMPQAEGFGWQADSDNAKRALAILDDVTKEYNGDPDRTYLTGLSMGGFGTWSIAAAHPDRWAAIVPVCGGLRFPPRKGDTSAGPTPDEVAAKIKHIPCWCWHGGADGVVKPDLSRVVIEALKKAGAEPRYTELAHVGHNSWDAAYASSDLYDWLFKQKKSK